MTAQQHGAEYHGEQRRETGTERSGRERTRCPECFAWTYDEDLFCACCGAPLIGEEARPSHPISIYCTQCGILLEHPSLHSHANIRKEKNPQQREEEGKMDDL